MDTLLRQFTGDRQTKAALLEYLTLYFQEQIVERAMKKEDTASLADAISELTKGFEQLEVDYGIKVEKAAPINAAR